MVEQSGPPYHHDDVFPMSNTDARTVKCPTCGAEPKKWCVTKEGNELSDSHVKRWTASRVVLTEIRKQQKTT